MKVVEINKEKICAFNSYEEAIKYLEKITKNSEEKKCEKTN